MDRFGRDVRYAWRALTRRPGFVLAALLTLALGIGATTAIFGVVRSILLSPLPYVESDRLGLFGQAPDDAEPELISAISVANYTDVREQARALEVSALYTRASLVLSGLGDAEAIPGARVTSDFFHVFGAEPAMGRAFTAEESTPTGPQAVIVSYAFWQERLGGAPDVLSRTHRNAFAVLGISLKAGRLFEGSDRFGGPPVALVNATAARRFWPDADPVGKRISVGVTFAGPDEWTVVGVVNDIRAVSLLEEPEPEIPLPMAQAASGAASIVMRAQDGAAVMSAARAELRTLDAAMPLIRPGMMSELVSSQRATTRFYLMLLSLFAGIAILLAAVGIYGVVAIIVARRSREIGVRMALGARIQQVMTLVVWQGIGPALIGLAVGVTGAALTGGVIEKLLFDVKPYDPLTFVGVTLLLLAVVGLACIVPASRAGRIPPASALRAE